MLTRRLLSSGLRFSPAVACRSCHVTYIPSKKPFVYYVEKDGVKVPLDLEGRNAPRWSDPGNEEFWRTVEDFCADQPPVPFPYRRAAYLFGIPIVSGIFYLIFLRPGSAGASWCDGWVNQDKFLMFMFREDEFLTKDDYELIAKRREIGRTMPLLTRLGETWRRHPIDIERNSMAHYRSTSRFMMGEAENRMRERTPQQVYGDQNAFVFNASLIRQLEAKRVNTRPDITLVGGVGGWEQ